MRARRVYGGPNERGFGLLIVRTERVADATTEGRDGWASSGLQRDWLESEAIRRQMMATSAEQSPKLDNENGCG